jgi:hypothetical protein
MPGKAIQQGGFTGTGFANDPHDFARMEIETDVTTAKLRTVAFAEIRNTE